MLNSDTKRLVWGILFLAWSALIIILSVIPNDGLSKMGIDNSGFRWDYLEHLSVFILFSVLYLLWRKDDTVKKRVAGLIIIGVLFAACTELFQLFVESRSFNYLDLLFNLAGLLIGMLIMKFLQKSRLSSAT